MFDFFFKKTPFNFLSLKDLDRTNLKKIFLNQGFIVVKNFFDKERIKTYLRQINKTLGIEDNVNEPKVLTDAINSDEFYLDFILDKNLIKINQNIFGEDYKFLQHFDLHGNQNAHQWHRDLATKNGGVVELNNNNFLSAKCALYLEVKDSVFALVSNSTKSNSKNILFGKDVYDIKNYDKFLKLEDNIEINKDKIYFFNPEPGDLVFFDMRILHTACNIDMTFRPTDNLDQKEKKVIWPTFGANNFYTECIYQYFKFIRKDFGTMKFSLKIEELLNSKKLLPNTYENISKKHIDFCIKNIMYSAHHDSCIYKKDSSSEVIELRKSFIDNFSKDSKYELLRKKQEKIIHSYRKV